MRTSWFHFDILITFVYSKNMFDPSLISVPGTFIVFSVGPVSQVL